MRTEQRPAGDGTASGLGELLEEGAALRMSQRIVDGAAADVERRGYLVGSESRSPERGHGFMPGVKCLERVCHVPEHSMAGRYPSRGAIKAITWPGGTR